MGFSRREYWRGAFPSSRGSSNPGIEPRSPSLQADSLPAEPPGKPGNRGEGSLSLLQQIFLTQESNKGLLHCRRILYQLSQQGSPGTLERAAYPFSRGQKERRPVKEPRKRSRCFLLKSKHVPERESESDWLPLGDEIIEAFPLLLCGLALFLNFFRALFYSQNKH